MKVENKIALPMQGKSKSTGEIKYKYDLRNAQIDINSFPYPLLKKVISECINLEERELLNYGEHQGELGLREQIARYLFLARGVKCSSSQILIGAGTQQNLSMLTLILREVDNSVAFEEPGYNGARQIFVNNNYNVLPIPLEEDGININLLNNSKCKIVYITPSHQFPCGMVMPVSKRFTLLQWAQQREGYIIEDDYDGEFRYGGKPIPALQGLDRNGKVIYLGTFSKSLVPSIRISYMVLPESLIRIYIKKYSLYEQPTSRLNQKALQLFMERGYWDRHIKRMRTIYKKKHELLIDSINKILDDRVEIVGKDAGLHILLKVKNNMSEQQLIEAAQKNGIAVSPTSIYWYCRKENIPPSVFIGFGGISLEDIPDSVKGLNKSWFW
jgi:GntR family transcriptional regulator/MocR family aminotransferase